MRSGARPQRARAAPPKPAAPASGRQRLTGQSPCAIYIAPAFCSSVPESRPRGPDVLHPVSPAAPAFPTPPHTLAAQPCKLAKNSTSVYAHRERERERPFVVGPFSALMLPSGRRVLSLGRFRTILSGAAATAAAPKWSCPPVSTGRRRLPPHPGPALERHLSSASSSFSARRRPQGARGPFSSSHKSFSDLHLDAPAFTSADDTIYALSTAQGRAGIAVIRISGPRCLDVRTPSTFAPPLPSPHLCPHPVRSIRG
jgi:hypothetical protein